jgi:NAD(P)-dependent dehydrogenase (short-subunit alcohol dehydrogenase family)
MSMVGPVPVPKPQTTPLTVVITGASRGLGYELVVQYATAHKDNVIIAGVRNPSAEALKPFSAHSNIHIVHLDVADESSIRASVKEVERFTDHVDVLINNAGIFGGAEGVDPTTATAAQLVEVFNVNVVGVVLTTQAYLPLLRKSSAPKVINVSSGMGSNELVNVLGRPVLAYGMSKAALNYATSAFRYAEPKVTFLAISPGWVETDMGKANGGKPPVSPSDSIKAIRYYIGEKTAANSGEFFDVMSGKLIAY